MNKTMEQLETLHCVLVDIIDNKELEGEIRTKCWSFDIEIKKMIKQAKCIHFNKDTEITRMHNDTYEVTKCLDCKKIIEYKRLY